MSPLGLLHTAVSFLAMGSGAVALIRDGRIDPASRTGQAYLRAMWIASVTAFGLGTFGPGHVLTIVTMALLLAAAFAGSDKVWGRAAPYVQVGSLSASFLLLMVFATTETLIRFPVGQPFAASPADPALAPVRLALLAAFAMGFIHQVRELRAARGKRPVATQTTAFAGR